MGSHETPSPCIEKLLGDICKELPKHLSPWFDIDHKSELESRAKLSVFFLYHLALLELGEHQLKLKEDM